VNIGDEEVVVTVEPVEDPAHRDDPAPAEQPDEAEPDLVPANVLTLMTSPS
jgi:hypothetical protein